MSTTEIRNDYKIIILTLDCNNLENGNWFAEISKINDYKNDQKKSSRFILYHKILTQTI
jgi:hypothetical protein